jgi:hypothetical protein
MCAPLCIPTGESTISAPVVPNRKPPPSFTRQGAFDGAAFAEYQNNQRQTNPYQQGRTHQFGSEYLPWETLTVRRFARL